MGACSGNCVMRLPRYDTDRTVSRESSLCKLRFQVSVRGIFISMGCVWISANAGKMKLGVTLIGNGFPPGTSRHGFSKPPVGDVMVTRAPPRGDPLLALF